MLHPHSGVFAVHYAGTVTAAGSNTHRNNSQITDYYSVPQNTLSLGNKAVRKQEEKHRQCAILQAQLLIVAGQKSSTREDKHILRIT